MNLSMDTNDNPFENYYDFTYNDPEDSTEGE